MADLNVDTSFENDNLLAGTFPLSTEKGTLITGQNLTRGTVLGKITIGAVTQGFAGTGNGVLTMDVTTPVLANAQVGAYKAKCIVASTDAATFEVFDPKGNSLGIVALGATFSNQLKFVIADGATDFTVGATFTLTVAAGSGKLKKVDSTNVDGSQYPYGILTRDVNATSEDRECGVYLSGEFNETALVFGGSDVIGTHKAALRDLGIYTKVQNVN